MVFGINCEKGPAMSSKQPEEARQKQGKAFADKRKSKGHTQASLGKAFGVTRETVAEWERGKKQEVPKMAWLAIEAVEPREKKSKK